MKFLNFIKKHCFLFISLLIILIVLIVGIILMKNLFFSNSGDVFGNRLDGIEDHVISDEILNKIKTELEVNEQINSVKNNIVGKRVDFIIDVKIDVDIITAKSFADKILEYFDDNIKSFYDIQVMITNEDSENLNYPIIGYKHKSKVGFSW